MLLSILIFLAVLSLVVFFHELGHFIAAKRLGVAVEEFGFGYPPRLFGKKIGSTVYSVNLIPLGGFVRLKGENAEIAGLGDSDSFSIKSPYKRVVILISGVLGNIILTWLIFSLLLIVGLPVLEDRVHLEKTFPNSVAQQAGLLPGDIIVSLDQNKVFWADELINYIQVHQGQPVVVTVLRNGQLMDFVATPNPLLGVEISNSIIRHVSWWQAPFEGARETINLCSAMLAGLFKIVTGLFRHEAVGESLSGPVGIFKLTEFYGSLGWRYLMQFVGLLSANLALVNLLPIPALDGGRLVFVFYEIAAKRRPSVRFERFVHTFGFILLLIFLVFISFQDIKRFF